MCLGVPGKVVEVGDPGAELLMGRVDFGGLIRGVCLAYVPDVSEGEYVLVHVGFAISKINEAEANELFAYLAEIDELTQQQEAQRGAGPSPEGTRPPEAGGGGR